MDLTARDPSKVPRCILSGTAGVSEAQAERESAREILSALLREGSLPFERHCGVTLSLSERESAREIPERSFCAKDLCLRARIIAGVGKAGVRTRNPERPEGLPKGAEGSTLRRHRKPEQDKAAPKLTAQIPERGLSSTLLHHSQIVNEANYAFGDFLGFNFAYNNFLFQYIRQPSIAEYQCGGLKGLLGIWKTLSHGTASLGRRILKK